MRSDREERIRERAYTIWQREGRAHGKHVEHWHRAEREIAAEDAGDDATPRRASRTGSSAAPRATKARAAKSAPGGEKPAPRKTTRRRAPSQEA